MKKLILICLVFLSSCSLQLEDKRIDPEKVAQILQEQSVIIEAIVKEIGVLQERGYLDKPKEF